MAPQRKAIESNGIGRRGEDLAADFFIRRGYTIVARNWHCRGGELDLVIMKGDELRIIEVKARQVNPGPGGPEETVTDGKLARIGEAAARFLAEHPELPAEAHVDVLAVAFTHTGVPVYRWLKDFE